MIQLHQQIESDGPSSAVTPEEALETLLETWLVYPMHACIFQDPP